MPFYDALVAYDRGFAVVREPFGDREASAPCASHSFLRGFHSAAAAAAAVVVGK